MNTYLKKVKKLNTKQKEVWTHILDFDLFNLQIHLLLLFYHKKS
jgi:hypothetical protein